MLNEFEPIIKQYSIQLVDAIGEVAQENHGVVDMSDWFNRFSFDVPVSDYHADGRLLVHFRSGKILGH